ncbi:MAG: TetR/AcrR family transcriptional regulator [Cyanobacteria bacterium J06631_12]
MARPRKITTEQILKAAQAVFLEKGFGASTQEIARAAGISEGSIFKRFPTKEALFVAAMGMSTSAFLPLVEATVGKGDLQENLREIGLELIGVFHELVPKMMMLRSKGLSVPAMLMKSKDAPPVQLLKLLTDLFERETALGRMRCQNPQTVAMMLIGSLMHYVIFVQRSAPLPEAEEYVDSVVELLWQSIRPESDF